MTPEPLQMLSRDIRHINRVNGWHVTEPEDWYKEYKVPAILALIHSEVSEALEAFRHNDLSHFNEEMADVLIRVLDCMGGLSDDIDVAVAETLERNKLRGYRHGGKRI